MKAIFYNFTLLVLFTINGFILSCEKNDEMISNFLMNSHIGSQKSANKKILERSMNFCLNNINPENKGLDTDNQSIFNNTISFYLLNEICENKDYSDSSDSDLIVLGEIKENLLKNIFNLYVKGYKKLDMSVTGKNFYLNYLSGTKFFNFLQNIAFENSLLQEYNGQNSLHEKILFCKNILNNN